MIEFPDLIQRIGAFVALLGGVGAAAGGIAYWLFKQFAQGWLSAQFNRDLEAFKAEKGRELEALKAEASRLLDRAAHFHRHEFDVLPTAHGLLLKAHGAVAQAVNRFAQVPDLGRMTNAELEEFLAVSQLPESMKETLRNSTNRTGEYTKMRLWQIGIEASKAQAEFQNHVLLNDVFIEEKIAKNLKDAAEYLRNAVVCQELAGQFSDNDLRKDARTAYNEADRLVPVIKAQIRNRLSSVEFRAAEER
jgi:hypothetical protein